MILSFLLPAAAALTLDEAVQRAHEVDPDLIVAQLTEQRARLDTSAATVDSIVNLRARANRSWSGGTALNTSSLKVDVPIVDVAAWFNALSLAASAREARWTAQGANLDAEYGAAALYFGVLAADARADAAQATVTAAEATAAAIHARVSAGLDGELTGRSADLEVLAARAELARAQARRTVERARLARALELQVDALTAPAALPALPTDVSASPALRAEEQAVHAAKLAQDAAWSQLIPTGDVYVQTNLLSEAGAAPFGTWTAGVAAKWTLDGIAGPALRAKQAAIDVKIETTRLEALTLDLQLALDEARANAAAADAVASAGAARVELADSALKIGQTRLAAGLSSSLDVLRLQDEAAFARADRVEADLARALARLEARRVAGVAWGR